MSHGSVDLSSLPRGSSVEVERGNRYIRKEMSRLTLDIRDVRKRSFLSISLVSKSSPSGSERTGETSRIKLTV